MQTRASLNLLAGVLLTASAWHGTAANPAQPDGLEEEATRSQLYTERFRPQFHWSPPFGWMNDPNGMIWLDGTYHLFYQYNPLGDQFGNIAWGHTVSDDLFFWQPLTVALPPDGSNLIFSGSAVLDENNTSGLCDETAALEDTCVVAIYTTLRPTPIGFNQTQDIAVSNDAGINWTKYDGNPVIDLGLADFRDPKVFWYEPDQRWIMVITLPLEHQVLIFASPNLRDWEEVSRFGPAGATGGAWECPDLFPLPVDGNPEDTRWVMSISLNPGGPSGGSGGQYFIGEFDGREFVAAEPDTPEEVFWLDYGRDFYCSTTYANLPPELGQRWIGWMNNWEYASDIPTFPWRGSMNVPRRLALETYPEGVRLRQRPVDEIESLVRSDGAFTSNSLVEANDLLRRLDPATGSWQMTLQARPAGLTELGVRIVSVLEDGTSVPTAVIAYRPESQDFFVHRVAEGNVEVSPGFPGVHVAPLPLEDGQMRLRLLVDRNSVEVFGNEGRSVVSDLLFPVSAETRVEVFALGGEPEALDVRFAPLTSVWR